MRAADILDDQIIHVKRGRLNGLGFEPAFNAYFDFYLDCRYFGESLLDLQDVTFHLYLRKNLNASNPRWKMPTIRQMMNKFGISQHKLYTMFTRLEKAHLLNKESGTRTGTSNVRNSYILSDPIPTLTEFLEVAGQNLFRLPLLEGYQPCIKNQYMHVSEINTDHVSEIDTDQQTLNPKQTENTLEDKLWNNVLGQLQLQLPKDSFATFLADTTLQSIEDGVAVITTPRSYAKDWLENRMSNQIKKMLAMELRMAGGQKLESVRCEIA